VIGNDFGVHQRLNSSGLVHASNTTRAGPLMVRETMSSRSDFRSTVVASRVPANGTGAKQISGLGDKAFSAITGVEALFGNVSITVSNLRSDAAAETPIRTLQPKL